MKEKVFNLTNKKKWLVLILLMFAGGIIYNLPYFRSTFYTPLQEALGLTDSHGKYGLLITVYGLLSLLFYIPGGWIADTFSTKKLLVGSLISTGLLGFWFATWPSFPIALTIHGLWAITTVLTFWSAYIKIVNLLSESAEESAKNYGYLEGGGGFVQLIFLLSGLGLFSVLGATASSLTVVMVSYSAILILVGILLFVVLPEPIGGKDRITAKDTLRGLAKVLKMPVTYILAVALFGCFVVTSGTNYFMPYLEQACLVTATVAGTINVIRSNVMRMAAGPLFGNAAKRVGRSTLLMKWAFIGTTLVLGLLILVPLNPALLVFACCVIFAVSFGIYGIRAVYWSIIDEMETPAHAVGSVIGFASLVGFMPDVFIYTWFGNIIDTYPMEQSYRIIFAIMAGFLVVAGAVMFVADHIIAKKRKKA